MDFSKYYLQMGPKKLHPLLSQLDVVHINREEASYLTGVKYEDYRGVFKKLDKLIDGIVAMTDGKKGVMVSDGRMIYKAGVYKEKFIADRTGAGDAFGSGFVAGLIGKGQKKGKGESGKWKGSAFSKESIIRAIELASANATSVVEHVGAQQGILTGAQFRGQGRWKHLPVKIAKLHS
jgi:sugar/nucleoside kinase (ribokinase family)